MSSRGRDGGNEQPYTGALGSTRLEPAFLTGADGIARRIDLVRGVNAATDASLAASALEGTLHRLEGGVYLAVPYVYHDPAARKFALVVPVGRAHEELSLRADLLLRLVGDGTAPIPAYVREARVVIGMEGLQRYLADAGASADASGKLEAVAVREERLRERAEEVTRREDELRQRADELRQVRAEVDRQAAALVAREEALADEEHSLRANKAALQNRDRMLEARAEVLEAREMAALEARRESEASMEAEPIESAEADAGDDGESIEAEEPVEELTSLPTSEMADESREGELLEAEAFEGDGPDEQDAGVHDVEPLGDPSVPEAWAARGSDAYAAVVDGDARLWMRGTAEHASRLGHGGATLLLQVDPDSAFPLALLSVMGSADEGRIARVVLDGTRPDDRAVVETLGRDFRVRLELVSATGRALGSFAVADQCEANAQRVLAVLAGRAKGSDEARRAEADQMLRMGVPVPVGESLAQAFEDESALATAVGAVRGVEALDALSEGGLRDRFMLARGVPTARLDSFGKRVILAALRCGVMLPPRVVARAIALGLAHDEKAIVQRMLTTYARTCDSSLAAIGRTPAEASAAWQPLLAWAAHVGAPVPDTVRATLRGLFDPEDASSMLAPDARPVPETAQLEAMSDEALLTYADHPAALMVVAREMVRRDATQFLAPLSRALRVLPPDEAVALASEMIPMGDALGDLWVELLGSRRAHAAVLGAVATALIKLRRGLNSLVQRALGRDGADGAVFAWAAGEFGAAAVRSVGQKEGADVDRVAAVLAHAIRAGAGRDVEKVRASGGTAAEAAARATGRVDEARAFDLAMRHGAAHDSDAEKWASALCAAVVKQDDARRERRGGASDGA